MNSAVSIQLKRVCVVLGMTASLASAYEAGPGNGDGTPWWENTEVSLELTLRQQAWSSDYAGGSPPYNARGTRQQSQYEAYVTVQSQITDNVGATIQIASGYGSNPITSHFQAMDDKFASDDLWLRQAYVNWQPPQVEGANVFAGKMPNIFYRAGGNQVIWDYHVTHEGAAANHSTSIFGDATTTLNTNVGAFWVEEGHNDPSTSSSPAPDVMLYVAQAYLARQLDETSRCLAGASFYSYSNIINQGGFGVVVILVTVGLLLLAAVAAAAYVGVSTWLSAGPRGVQFTSDFDLVELFAECTREINGMPCMLFGTWINNTSAGQSTDDDTAWSIGGRINKAEAPGSWEAGYDYRDIERDSVPGIFTDHYFVGGGVGMGGMGSTGHNFTAAYQCAKNVQVACRLILSEIKGSSSDDDFTLFQVDLRLRTP